MPLKNADAFKQYQKTYREKNADKARIRGRAWYLANREKVLKKQAQRYRESPEEFIEKSRKWSETHRERKNELERNRRLRSRYSLKISAWHEMLIAQSGRCAICSKPMKKPHVDHCHSTGRIRGLLCLRCNITLGMAEDSVDVLRSAITYLAST